MEIMIVNHKEVRQLLPMDECIDVMAQALRTLSEGQADNPLRSMLWLPEKVGLLGMMPAYLGDIEMMGIKLVSVMPGNHGTQYDSHQGGVLVFETKHGRLLAMVDASEITAIRTAAVSGLATRLLAREDAGDLAILGSGVQARTHLEAMKVARSLRRVRVWSPNAERLRAFVERESQKHGLEIEAADSAQAAVEGADLICTTTSAKTPILMGEWIAGGAHLNVVGSSVRTTREVNTGAMVRAKLFVDRRESTLNEAGDFLFPKSEGAIDDSHIQAELGEILLGRHPGRRSAGEITLFKSLGLAVEDLASAYYIYRQAREKGMGTMIEFGATRDEAH